MRKLSLVLLNIFLVFNLISCGSQGSDIVINFVDNEIEVEENEKRDITIQSKDKFKQFRNNKTKINKEDLKSYFENDLTLKKFEAPKKTIEEYENWFINMARDRGESAKEISDAFRSVDILIGEDIVKFPVILDTVIFNDREAYAIAYLCEESENLDMEAQEAMELRRFDDVLIIGVYKDSADIFYKDKYKYKF
ncbi:hypothetical protein [Clostridium sp. LIBA-8841]|uniref:hypothetical protein n=1 Tax=Clostridium sp. LIBA-8841 TaxID=2987530 RepID=UPI002AC7AF69|nr:hypothetical protein [Clostridium sp. LIBA-8841]MDZ5254441.1 hypothetical protein [Clostridium sp. LIBA-8841]